LSNESTEANKTNNNAVQTNGTTPEPIQNGNEKEGPLSEKCDDLNANEKNEITNNGMTYSHISHSLR